MHVVWICEYVHKRNVTKCMHGFMRNSVVENLLMENKHEIKSSCRPNFNTEGLDCDTKRSNAVLDV